MIRLCVVYTSHASQRKVKCTTPMPLSERSSVQLSCLSVKGQVYNSSLSVKGQVYNSHTCQ
ncbi:hypothetical protein DPMN_092021 [Dreissena polymorpha]|uniref:Uncharacterized protein n=1 Tax=Dreissena polymorpha TaxID=45954 RepID=A0A9D4L1G7_DREPO|nr:hypothetical protein DPMN_092021 [Dreissena polymorpha]